MTTFAVRQAGHVFVYVRGVLVFKTWPDLGLSCLFHDVGDPLWLTESADL